MLNLSPIITGGSNTRLIPANSISTLERSETKGGDSPSDLHCHLDYLAVKCEFPESKLPDFLNYVTNCNHTEELGKPFLIGGNYYHDNRFEGTLGVVGGYSTDEESRLVTAVVRFSGQFWESKTVFESYTFCVGLRNSYSATCLRFDAAVDDYTLERIPLAEMREAWEKGNHFYFQKWTSITSGKTVQDQESTHYLGSRESDKVVRVYRHHFEDKSECDRWETEYKGELAQRYFESFCSLGYDLKDAILSDENVDIEALKTEWDCELQRTLGTIAVGAVDFRDRSTRKDRSKACASETERLSWFAKFVESIGGWVKARKRGVNRCLEKTKRFLYRQASGTLSAMRDGMGVTMFRLWIDDLCARGKEKRSPYQERLVKDIQDFPDLMRIGYA